MECEKTRVPDALGEGSIERARPSLPSQQSRFYRDIDKRSLNKERGEVEAEGPVEKMSYTMKG